jgi:hypothetical protein
MGARLIVPQAALDHAVAHESSIRQALETACTTDAAYIIQVGFNEDMLQSHQGTLQEIHISLNFDIQPNDEPQILDRLSRILSPFPCTVHTPSADLPLSIVGTNLRRGRCGLRFAAVGYIFPTAISKPTTIHHQSV